jgi:nucleoside-diphosphate-sugar epimerase
VQLARIARDAGARRFVFVSSNAAHGAGKNAADILTEEQPCRPLSHYGRSKAEAEEQLLKMHAPGQFDVVVLRPCMFYGPPVPQRHIDVFNRIRAGRLPLVGSGQYARSLTYIDDLVAGTRTALTHPAAAGEVFYFCDSQVYTTLSVCEAMAAALGVPARFIRIPAFSASLAYGVDCALAKLGLYSMNFHLLGEANWHVGCSNAKARRLLGYGSSVEVFEGYRRAVAWCRAQGRLG